MEFPFKDLPDDIVLKDPQNPLSAVAKGTEERVYKFSYHPKTGRVLYSYPGDRHAVAIGEVGDAEHFDEYVRIIYDPKNNVAGSRIWGDASYYNRSPDEDAKSLQVQSDAFKFFKKLDHSLRWVLNLTNSDLTSDEEEALDSSKVSEDRILFAPPNG